MGYAYLFESMFLFPSEIYPGMKLLAHMVVSAFLEIFLQFWRVAAPIYISTNSVQGLPLLHILAN